MTPAAAHSLKRKRVLQAALTAACALALTLCCAGHYYFEGHTYKWYEYLAPALTVSLFIWVGAGFLPVWMGAWSRRPVQGAAPVRGRARDYWFIALFVICAHAVYFVLALVYYRAVHGYSSGLFSYLYASDSPHYLDIAENWYSDTGDMSRVVRLVFLPLYPLCIRALSFITGEYYYTGIALSVLCSVGAAEILYKLALIGFSRRASLRAVKYFCLFPGFFFYGCVLSESLFMLLSLSCLYLCARRRWLLCALLGMLAAFTRSPGVILIAPVLFELIGEAIRAEKGERKKPLVMCAACPLIIALGFAAYLYINYRVSGDWLRFLKYQKTNWFQSPGWFFDTPRYQLSYFISYIRDGSVPRALGLWGSNLFAQAAALVLMALTVKRQRPSHGAFFIAYYVYVTGVTWLLSAPRYMLACFPLVFALSRLGRRRGRDIALSAACAALSLLLFWAYLSNGVPVY